jgi:hypothetical protein
MEFVPYPKTPRLRRDIVVTEKIDGTNAQVVITPAYSGAAHDPFCIISDDEQWVIRAGSRNRWIRPGKDTDNYGFAAWVEANAEELLKLGEGQHFGEWWGHGIARGYGQDRKRFSLFNTARWGAHNPNTPACCDVVPVIAVGSLLEVDDVISMLRESGSVAAPGFMNPEGIIVYHTASKQPYKVLLENDELPKGLVKA